MSIFGEEILPSVQNAKHVSQISQRNRSFIFLTFRMHIIGTIGWKSLWDRISSFLCLRPEKRDQFLIRQYAKKVDVWKKSLSRKRQAGWLSLYRHQSLAELFSRFEPCRCQKCYIYYYWENFEIVAY